MTVDPNYLPPEAFTQLIDPKGRAAARGNTLLEKFQNLGERTALGCLIWKGGINHNGYGTTMIEGRHWLVHRLSWIYHKGRIPDGKIIRHKICGNRLCFEIDHLEDGTQAENVADTIRQGKHQRIQGSRHPNSRLTEDDVVKMRESTLSFTELLKQWPISTGALHNILVGNTWKHAGGPIRGIHRAKGDRIAASKLNAEKVREIKRSTDSSAALARRFEVSHATIRHIRTGKYWSHVTLDSEDPESGAS